MRHTVISTVAAVVLVALSSPAVGFARSDSRSAAPKNPASVLNGVYRVSYTQKELIALGTSPQYAKTNYGTLTLWLNDGRYRLRQIPHGNGVCQGPFTVSGKTVAFDFNDVPHCNGVVKATWSLGNGVLRLRVTFASDAGDKVLFSSKPLKKIG